MTDAPSPAPPWREEDRLAALRGYAILDTPPEAGFDDIVRIAAQICGAPMALISLVDEERQWFKAALGVGLAQTPREIAFCAHAIRQPGVLVVEDAATDARFAANPLVTGDPNLRFYAGAPLKTDQGLPLGTLCVLDDKPRRLTAEQRAALEALARQVMVQLDLRQALARETSSEERHRRILESAIDYAIVSMDLGGVVTSWNAGAQHILGWSEAEMLGRRCDDFFTPEDRAEGVPEREMGQALVSGRGSDERWHMRKGGGRFWAAGEMMPLTDEAGTPVGFLKILRDRSEFRAAQEALEAARAAAERDRLLLTGELEHRVKNTLALVQAIVRQSFRAAATPAETAAAIEDRLIALARANDTLIRSDWAAAPIAAIIQDATEVHVARHERIQAAGPDLNIAPRAAVGLALAFHELCTNAIKYGALSNATGRVLIDWSVDEEGPRAMFRLRWREEGGPPVAPPTHSGFGAKLIKASVAGEPGGGSRIDYNPTGVAVEIYAPLRLMTEV